MKGVHCAVRIGFLNTVTVNPLTSELNTSAQRCLPRFFTGILIFKGLTVRRLYKSFGVKGLILVYKREIKKCKIFRK
jgi:hypothetical protein